MNELQQVPVDKLYPHPQNPRLVQREDVIASIETQLREKGSFDPAHALLVRPYADGYQIVMGHHRYTAAKSAGLDSVPCWVRQLSDEDAFMLLATSNTQDSMDPLEWGIHALAYVELANNRHDNGSGVREYARQLGREASYVTQLRNAAVVLDHVLSEHCDLEPSVQISEHYTSDHSVQMKKALVGKAYHLNEIHKCPKHLWMMLVDHLIADGWSVADTKERTAGLRELSIPAKWTDFLPMEKAGALILSGRATRSGVDNVIALIESVETTIDQLKPLGSDDANVFRAWLVSERSSDPLSTKPIRDYQDAYKAKQSKLRLAAANHIVSDDPNYDGDEWYTPEDIVEAAKAVMGTIDIDPASCDAAQAVVKAGTYYTKQDDSLRDDIYWRGNVWLNPPYSTPLVEQFIEKLIAEYENGNTNQAIIITNNSSETDWFQTLLERFPACFKRRRAKFWRPNTDDFGARQGQTLFYLGDNVDKFREVFSELGVVVSRI